MERTGDNFSNHGSELNSQTRKIPIVSNLSYKKNAPLNNNNHYYQGAQDDKKFSFNSSYDQRLNETQVSGTPVITNQGGPQSQQYIINTYG